MVLNYSKGILQISFGGDTFSIVLPGGKIPGKSNNVVISGERMFGDYGELILFDSPGEYEVYDTTLFGYGIGQDNSAYFMAIDGINVFYTPRVFSKEDIDAEALEHISSIDLLIVPAGHDGDVGGLMKLVDAKNLMVVGGDVADEVASGFGEIEKAGDKMTIKKNDVQSQASKLFVLK